MTCPTGRCRRHFRCSHCMNVSGPAVLNVHRLRLTNANANANPLPVLTEDDFALLTSLRLPDREEPSG